MTPSERSNDARIASVTRWERQRERDRLTAAVIETALQVFPEGSPILNDRGNAEVTYDEWNAMRAALSELGAMA